MIYIFKLLFSKVLYELHKYLVIMIFLKFQNMFDWLRFPVLADFRWLYYALSVEAIANLLFSSNYSNLASVSQRNTFAAGQSC